MTIDVKIKDENPQCNFNREAAKISSGEIDKYESLKGEEIYYLLIKEEWVYIFSIRKSF